MSNKAENPQSPYKTTLNPPPSPSQAERVSLPREMVWAQQRHHQLRQHHVGHAHHLPGLQDQPLSSSSLPFYCCLFTFLFLSSSPFSFINSVLFVLSILLLLFYHTSPDQIFLFQCVTMEGWTPIMYWVRSIDTKHLYSTVMITHQGTQQKDMPCVEAIFITSLVQFCSKNPALLSNWRVRRIYYIPFTGSLQIWVQTWTCT